MRRVIVPEQAVQGSANIPACPPETFRTREMKSGLCVLHSTQLSISHSIGNRGLDVLSDNRNICEVRESFRSILTLIA